MQTVEHETFAKPAEVRTFPHGKAEILEVGDSTIGRLVLEPGWRWSNDVRPIAGTELCEAPHFQYHLQGHLKIRMADGREIEAGPGDVTSLPQGHDAWVVGDETVIVVDWYGSTNWAKAADAGGSTTP
ncbi:cupin domain-containing protein [Puerhibacterium puerhi]|uniref:cupin domain-containing protein n=1 Tax=Puerhibacterium puerhi TaxID=2692623 RepID=UPI0013585251|nr:cupin domain-containing protein [Puerhibacterium puerhi]